VGNRDYIASAVVILSILFLSGCAPKEVMVEGDSTYTLILARVGNRAQGVEYGAFCD